MLDPAFYPFHAEEVELRETHASRVFLAGDRAYKVKKPVVLPFLDYGAPERRLSMCREEVRLSRDLAPGIYLGVRGLKRAGGRYELTGEDDPEAFEYVVEMSQYPEEETVERLCAAGRLTEEDVERAGRYVARFHLSAPPIDGRGGGDEVVAAIVDTADTLVEMSEAGESAAWVARSRALSARDFVRSFADAAGPLFADRQRQGWVRDVHGDLRAEHVVVCRDRILVVDRIEFDPALREIDVAADIAFLAMDLTRLGAGWAVDRILTIYESEGIDLGPPALVSFYAAYRAWVRAKVAAVRALQSSAGAESRGLAVEASRSLMALGHRFAWRARMPFLLIVCGVAASGKTTLAEEIAETAGVARIGSDEVRKELAGVSAETRLGAEMYADEMNRATYEELGRRAAEALRSDGGVVVDGTFRRRIDREAFSRGLGERGVEPTFIRCAAPGQELVRRATARWAGGRGASDADANVVAAQVGTFEELGSGEPGWMIEIPTEQPVGEQLPAVGRIADRGLVLGLG